LGTGIPIITSFLGVVPKFFYSLNADKRNAMYADLHERRERIAQMVNEATGDELAAIGKAEISGEFIKNTRD
jgi:hypothetical protein